MQAHWMVSNTLSEDMDDKSMVLDPDFHGSPMKCYGEIVW